MIFQLWTSTLHLLVLTPNLFNKYFHSVFHDPSLPVLCGDLATDESLISINITIPDVYEALTSLDIEK